MMRGLLVLGAAWAVAAAVAPPAARADSSAEATLATRYAPVVRLVAQQQPCGSGEPYTPIDVASILGNSQVALRGPWAPDNLTKVAPTAADLAAGLPEYHLDLPGDALRPGCTYQLWQRQLDAAAPPATYARVVSEHGQTALQYWFFYIYNDFNNKHEGDWEMIQLDFSANDAIAALATSPSEVGYSQHNGAERAAWDDAKLEKVDGTHPVVYPAEGSHANYYQPAVYLGSSGTEGVGCDNTKAPSREIRPAVQLVPPDRAEMLQRYPWLGYQGHWGEQHPAFYNGPTGPNEHEQWINPITWAQTSWHPSAFAIPGAMTGVPRATDLFCGVVAGGSTLLTRAVAGGPTVFLTVLAALLLVLWCALRMQWRPSQPFQLARRRTLGQILTASLRMYRHNPLMYLTIGALFLPASIVIALLQHLLFAVTRLDALSQVAGPTNAFVAGSALGIGLVFGLITLTLVQAMVAVSVSRAADSSELLPRHAFAVIRGRILSLMAALVVMSAAVGLLELTLVALPIAIWLLVRWSLFAQCIVLEDLSWRAGLVRSHALVQGHWWRVAEVTLALVGLAMLLGPIAGVALLLATPLSLAAVNIVSGVVYALTIPFVAIATSYIYYDLRVRELVEVNPAVLPAEAVVTVGSITPGPAGV